MDLFVPNKVNDVPYGTRTVVYSIDFVGLTLELGMPSNIMYQIFNWLKWECSPSVHVIDLNLSDFHRNYNSQRSLNISSGEILCCFL